MPGRSSRVASARGPTPRKILLDGLGQAMRSVGVSAGRPVTTPWTTSTGPQAWRTGRRPTGGPFHGRGPAWQRDPRNTAARNARAADRHGGERLARPGFESSTSGPMSRRRLRHAVTKMPRPLAVAVGVTAGNHDRAVRAIVRAVHDRAPACRCSSAGPASPTNSTRPVWVRAGAAATPVAWVTVDDLARRPLRGCRQAWSVTEALGSGSGAGQHHLHVGDVALHERRFAGSEVEFQNRQKRSSNPRRSTADADLPGWRASAEGSRRSAGRCPGGRGSAGPMCGRPKRRSR